MRYVLASASPRRKELLKELLPSFEICPATGEELLPAGARTPAEVVEALSMQKAREVCLRLTQGGGYAAAKADDTLVVIGADTIVVCGEELLGKPADEAEAFRMLSLLRGRAHEVYTGVTICVCGVAESGSLRSRSFHVCTRGNCAQMTDEEIRAYIATGEPFDKAGGYGIQGHFCRYIEGIEGDYYNVMGLPVARLYRELKGQQALF